MQLCTTQSTVIIGRYVLMIIITIISLISLIIVDDLVVKMAKKHHRLILHTNAEPEQFGHPDTTVAGLANCEAHLLRLLHLFVKCIRTKIERHILRAMICSREVCSYTVNRKEFGNVTAD